MNEKLELRMYGLVIYQLRPIQCGIQFQHSTTEYEKLHHDDMYENWRDNWKTSIILNGGTTNFNKDYLGTINRYYQELLDNNIKCAPFYEPDLGGQMTAISFIVDERVFNKKINSEFMFENAFTNPLDMSEDTMKIIFLTNFLKNFELWR
jgi:hypothetical protein